MATKTHEEIIKSLRAQLLKARKENKALREAAGTGANNSPAPGAGQEENNSPGANNSPAPGAFSPGVSVPTPPKKKSRGRFGRRPRNKGEQK